MTTTTTTTTNPTRDDRIIAERNDLWDDIGAGMAVTTSPTATRVGGQTKLDSATIEGGEYDGLTLERWRRGEEYVLVRSTTGERCFLLFTLQQAADFAHALKHVSGMATSTVDAPFLAAVIRDHLASKGVSETRAARESGISRYRLRKLLHEDVPMTHREHVALSEVGA